MIKNIKINTKIQEGFVMRLSSEFMLDDFQKSVVKWVRMGHIQTDEHWMNKIITPNGLIEALP